MSIEVQQGHAKRRLSLLCRGKYELYLKKQIAVVPVAADFRFLHKSTCF